MEGNPLIDLRLAWVLVMNAFMLRIVSAFLVIELDDGRTRKTELDESESKIESEFRVMILKVLTSKWNQWILLKRATRFSLKSLWTEVCSCIYTTFKICYKFTWNLVEIHWNYLSVRNAQLVRNWNMIYNEMKKNTWTATPFPPWIMQWPCWMRLELILVSCWLLFGLNCL